MENISVAEEASLFFEKKTKPHYLSHAVRALSDHIHEELKNFLIKDKGENLPGRQLYHHRILRLFEIKLSPIDKLDSPARVRIIRMEKESESKLYQSFVAKIEYDPNAFGMEKDKDAEKKLRFLIAHELGHIFILKGRFVGILKGDIGINETSIFNSQELPPDHDEEIKAWQFALALIHHKDQFYHQAPPKFCFCCQDKIFDVCLNELIDHPGAKNKLKSYYHDLKNDKKIVSCEKCSK